MAPKSVFGMSSRSKMSLFSEPSLRPAWPDTSSMRATLGSRCRVSPKGAVLRSRKRQRHLGADPVGRVAPGYVLEVRHVPQAMVVAEQRERETEIVRRAEAGFELLAKAAVCPAFPDPSDVLEGDALRAGPSVSDPSVKPNRFSV